MRGPSGASASRRVSGSSAGGGALHGQEAMDAGRSRGRRHHAGRRVRVGQPVSGAERSSGTQRRVAAPAQRTAPASRSAGIRSGPPHRQPAELNLPAVPTGYTELDQALGADKPFNGTTGLDPDAVDRRRGRRLRQRRSRTSPTATGIAVKVDSIGSSHETVLKTRIEGGSPPDMAALAQPTAVLAYAADGKLQDIAALVGPEGAAKLKAEFPSTIGLTSRGRQDLEHPDQGRRQVDDLVPGQGVRREGVRRSQDLGRARRPGRQDRRRRQRSRSAPAPAAPARRRAGS